VIIQINNRIFVPCSESSATKIAPEQKEFIQKHFNEPEALARLGNGHFSDIKEEKELPWAWEYDPHNFIESNF